MTELDDTDHHLLALLRENARAPIMALARKLKLTKDEAQERIARLEKDGTILGYTLREAVPASPPAASAPPETAAEPAVPPAPVASAILCLATELTRAGGVLQALRQLPGVVSVQGTRGRWDLVAQLGADSQEALRQALNAARLLDGVASTETCMLVDPEGPVDRVDPAKPN